MKIISSPILLFLLIVQNVGAEHALRGTQTQDDNGGLIIVKTVNGLNGTEVISTSFEDTSRRELATNRFVNAQRAVTLHDHGLVSFDLSHQQTDLCYTSGNAITSTFWGIVGANGQIRWDEVWTGGSLCFSRATKSGAADFHYILQYLGRDYGGTGVATRLPTNTNMRKITLRHKDTALCAGNGIATTTWYGSPCGGSTNHIQWEYLHTEAVGPGSSCNTDPSQRVESRSTINAAEYFGSCGVEATKVALPIHYDFYTFTKEGHHILHLCWGDGLPAITTHWVGYACANGEFMQWERMTTPAPNSPYYACVPFTHWDRSDASWGGEAAWLGTCGGSPSLPLVSDVVSRKPTYSVGVNPTTIHRDPARSNWDIDITASNFRYYNPTIYDRIYFTDTSDNPLFSTNWYSGRGRSGYDPLTVNGKTARINLKNVESRIAGHTQLRVYYAQHRGGTNYALLGLTGGSPVTVTLTS